LLGRVLAPCAENQLFLSRGNYGLAWLVRAGVVLLLAVIVVGVLGPMLIERRRRARSPAATAAAGEAGPVTAFRGPSLDGATLWSLVLVALFAWALWQSRTFGVRAGLFCWAVGIPGLALALVQLARDLTGHRSRPAPETTAAGGADVPRAVAPRRSVESCASTAAALRSSRPR